MTTIQSREMPEHEVGISFLRTIAALFVVLIHSAGMDSASAVFFQSLARFSVPAFVMISGYGMLAKKHHGSHLAKKCAALFAKMLIWAQSTIFTTCFGGSAAMRASEVCLSIC